MGRGVGCDSGRVSMAVVMLALVAVGGCTGGNNETVTVLPTATPTSAAATPTPTSKAATPTPTSKAATPTPTSAAATPTTTTTPSGPTPTPTAVGAQALWVENAIGSDVTEFKGGTLTTPGASVPKADVTNSSADIKPDPAGIIFDPSKDQWVTVCGNASGNHGSVAQFSAATVSSLPTNPSPKADVILSDDGTGKLVNCPWSMAFNQAAGFLVVANSDENGVTAGPGFVTAYQSSQLGTSGATVPAVTLLDPTEFVSPTGVVFDSSNDLFVSDFGPMQTPFPNKGGPGAIWMFKASTIAGFSPGTNTHKADAKLSDPTTATPVNGAFDGNGNLWVADCESVGASSKSTGEIYMFSKLSLTGTSTAATIFTTTTISVPSTGNMENTIDCPGGIAFDAQGNLWYSNFASVHADGAVGEFSASQLSVTGTSSPTPIIFLDGDATGTNFDGALGLTFGPPA